MKGHGKDARSTVVAQTDIADPKTPGIGGAAEQLGAAQGELAVGIHLKGGALALHAAQVLNEDVVQTAVRAGGHGAAEAQLVADNAGKGGAQLLGLGQLHGAVVGAAGEADAHGQQGADEQDDENGAQQLRQGEAAAVTKLVHGATSS